MSWSIILPLHSTEFLYTFNGPKSTKSDTSDTNTNIELELNNSNISLSKVNANLIADELYAANNGILIGTMLDSNKEIPIRLKGLTQDKDLTGNTSFLTVPLNGGFEYIDSFGKSSITNKSSKITRIDGQRVNMVEGWIWTQTLPSETENFIKEESDLYIVENDFIKVNSFTNI